VLLATGLLSDAAVVGVPNALAGPERRGRRGGSTGVVVEPGVLQRAVRDGLGAHAVPRPLRVLDALPRGRNDKVDRAALTALLGTP
jgi:acyl-coenzyme A synthetase/AMP-(fatty) acid ligase